MQRRTFLVSLLAVPAVARAQQQQARPAMTVYKDANCGCCSDWVEHVTKAGFKVTTRDVADLNSIKRDLGVPPRLWSCHTAVIGAYLVEGHVPADLIDKMLKEKPKGRGIAVPGMPIGSPGMEVPGTPAQRYQVMLFTTAGTATVYASR